MKLEELSPETLEKIRTYRWDRIIEKHEGPWTWDYLLESKTVEFLQMDGYEVLLPIDKEHHPNMSILRCIVSEDQHSLTIFLKDTTHDTGIFAGFLAICDKVPGEEWFIAIVYHEWFITENT